MAYKEFLQMKVQLNNKCKYSHTIYYKRHAVRQESKETPSDKTLFVVNIPPYCNKSVLHQIFGVFGEISTTYMQKIPGNVTSNSNIGSSYFRRDELKGFRVAYLIYKSPSSLIKAVKETCDDVIVLADLKEPPLVGIKKWCKEYAEKRPAQHLLQAEIDNYMQNFDKMDKEHKDEQLRKSKEPDEEGWTTINRRNPFPVLPTADQDQQLSKKKKKKKQEIGNFYRFQIRESKRDHIAQLRKKFEEDKKRISVMRESRKFRPY